MAIQQRKGDRLGEALVVCADAEEVEGDTHHSFHFISTASAKNL